MMRKRIVLLVSYICFMMLFAITTIQSFKPWNNIVRSKNSPVTSISKQVPNKLLIQPMQDMNSAEKCESLNVSLPQYTNEELDFMTAVIYYEAGADYCSDEWQLMVGSVVMNRVNDSRFPNTIQEVLTQEGQYQPFQDGIHLPQNVEKKVIERAKKNAKKVLEGYRNCPKTVVWQAEFVQGKGVYKKIGNTYFCY